MELTSLRRVKAALGITKTDQDLVLSRLISEASNQIVGWLRRFDKTGTEALQLAQRTEYFDPFPAQRVFYPSAYPITSIASVYTDFNGLYAGAESLVASANYMVGTDGRSIVFTSTPYNPDFGWYFPSRPKSIRIIYTGGLAADPVISSWTKSAEAGGTFVVGQYIQGETSGAIGRLTARAAGTVSYECLAGVFRASETITEYVSWDFTLTGGGSRNPTGVTATLTAATSLSMAESHPAIVGATEKQVRFLHKNADHFDTIQVVRDGETRTSRADLKNRYFLLPEIQDIIEYPYKNKMVA